MMKPFLLFFIALVFSTTTWAQVTIQYRDGTTQKEKVQDIDSMYFDTDATTISNSAMSFSEASNLSSRKDISILFIGNSLTQDAVSYVPLLLKEWAPNVHFKLYMFYNGGKTLQEQYMEYLIPNKACSIFSVCEDATSWTNFKNTVSLKTYLSKYNFDIVCLQDYFNYMSTYTTDNLTYFNNIVTYLQTYYQKPFEVVTFFHQPKRTTVNTVYPFTQNAIKLTLRETCASSVIPAGIATYEAMKTDLDNLGDVKHLSPDNTHSQEGLPCLMQAYVVAGWLMEKLGLPAPIINSQSRVTASNYTSINIPGMNLGTGVVEGTVLQNQIAQKIAVKALKLGKLLELQAMEEE